MNSLSSMSIVIPCHNEAGGMTQLRTQLEAARPKWRDAGMERVHIFLLDNGSTDSTLAEMRDVFSGSTDVTIHHSEVNLGIGGALREGLSHCGEDIMTMMDSDCTYDPAELAPMVRAIRDDGFEMATGSPYHPRGRVENVPQWRLVISRGLSVLYRVVSPLKLWTYTSMFRAYRRDSLAAISWKSDGFLSTTEVLMEGTAKGYRVFEYPTTLSVRQFGNSKIRIVSVARDHLSYLATIPGRRRS